MKPYLANAHSSLIVVTADNEYKADNYHIPRCKSELEKMGLSSIEVLPHYSRFINCFEQFEERCKAYELRNHKEVIRLNDGDAVIITRDKAKLIRA